jgi:hypothetical protein
MSETSFGISNPYFLDSNTARGRVRSGDADAPEESLIPERPKGNVTVAAASNYVSTGAKPVLGQSETSTNYVSTGATPVLFDPVVEKPIAPPPPKEEQGIIPGLYYSLKEGAQQTLGRLGATADVATGNNQGVVTSAMGSQELEKNSKAQALKELKDLRMKVLQSQSMPSTAPIASEDPKSAEHEAKRPRIGGIIAKEAPPHAPSTGSQEIQREPTYKEPPTGKGKSPPPIPQSQGEEERKV